MDRSKRRLIPIVDRGFQFKYTGIIMGVAAVISTVLGWFLLDAYKEMNELIEISAEINDQLDASDAQRVFILVVGFLAGEVIILGVMGLLITHKVCGPIFVFHRHLAALSDGKYPTLRPLRAGDEFHATFEVLREVVGQWRERDEHDLQKLEKLKADAEAKGLGAEHLEAIGAMIEDRRSRTT